MPADDQSELRQQAWSDAIQHERLPDVVTERLLEQGIVVCGMGIGSAYDYIFTPGTYTNTRPDGPRRARVIAQQMKRSGGNRAVPELGDFWQDIRRRAHQQLRQNTAAAGQGVLAHTALSQLRRVDATMTADATS